MEIMDKEDGILSNLILSICELLNNTNVQIFRRYLLCFLSIMDMLTYL